MHKSTEAVLSIYTIGHGTRPIDELVSMLEEHEIQRLVDVRSVPRSEHNPQFNREALGRRLRRSGIAYLHMKDLGGLRHPQESSPNEGWRNPSFRGFADYMQTPPFEKAIAKLVDLAAQKRCAIMCAETVPWRCHRSLISDALAARGLRVLHIYSPARSIPHQFTPMAKVRGTSITYPPSQAAGMGVFRADLTTSPEPPPGQLNGAATPSRSTARRGRY